MLNTVKAQLVERGRFVTVLRHRNYRLYYQGMISSILGFQMMIFTQGWLVYELTGSALYLGLVGGIQAVPSILLTLFGGAIADRNQPLRLVAFTQGLAAILMFILATLVVLGVVQVWHIFVTSLLIGAVHAFDSPARRSIWPHLIDRREMLSAAAMNSSLWSTTSIIGPAVGGIILTVAGGSIAGAGVSFYITFLGFAIMSGVMRYIRIPPIKRATEGNILRNILQGLVFIKSHHVIGFLIAISYFNGYFGLSFIILMPVFAKDVLGVGPSGLGLLVSVSGVGALVGTLGVASVGQSVPKWTLVVGGSILFGLFVVLFAISSWMPLSLLFVGLSGALMSVYNVAIMTSMHMLVPDEYRGRVTGLRGLSWSLMPLGSLQAGAVASLVNPQFAVAIGGAAVMAFGLFALLNSKIRNMLSLSLSWTEARAVA